MEALKVAYGEFIRGLWVSKAELLNLDAPFKYFDVPTLYLILRVQIKSFWATINYILVIK